MNPHEILGIPASASPEDIHAAYLAKVKAFPPDRAPEEFEQIRDAYERLRDPRNRAQALLLDPLSKAPLASLLDDAPPQRNFAGPQLWREALKAK
jgi:preprotein translocase subunit Sec63